MKQKKQLGLKIFLGILILLMVNVYSHSRWLSNKGNEFYEPDSSGSSQSLKATTCTDNTIRTNIIVGAGNFLNSHSSMLLLLNKIEMSDLNGVDYNDLRDTLYRVIDSMEGAKEAYTALTQKAEITPYNQAKIDLLISFDYTGFQEARDLNSILFKKVEEYLGNGDVTGYFGQVLSAMEAILEKLYQVKNTLDNDQLPVNLKLWRLNRIYSKTLLFGQYAAEVFYAVTD